MRHRLLPCFDSIVTGCCCVKSQQYPDTQGVARSNFCLQKWLNSLYYEQIGLTGTANAIRIFWTGDVAMSRGEPLNRQWKSLKAMQFLPLKAVILCGGVDFSSGNCSRTNAWTACASLESLSKDVIIGPFKRDFEKFVLRLTL